MSDLRFVSARGSAPPVTLSDAIAQGLAPDGGLYIPTRLPAADPAAFAGRSRLPDIARAALIGFFDGDPLQQALGEIADAALDLAARRPPLRRVRTRYLRSNSFTDRPPHSKTLARASWPRVCSGSTREPSNP